LNKFTFKWENKGKRPVVINLHNFLLLLVGKVYFLYALRCVPDKRN